jgi:hypothetical protein
MGNTKHEKECGIWKIDKTLKFECKKERENTKGKYQFFKCNCSRVLMDVLPQYSMLSFMEVRFTLQGHPYSLGYTGLFT